MRYTKKDLIGLLKTSYIKNKELIEEYKDLKITIEGLQMEVNDLQAEI